MGLAPRRHPLRRGESSSRPIKTTMTAFPLTRVEVPAPPATPPVQPPARPPLPPPPEGSPVPIDEPRSPGAAEPVREPTQPVPISGR